MLFEGAVLQGRTSIYHDWSQGLDPPVGFRGIRPPDTAGQR